MTRLPFGCHLLNRVESLSMTQPPVLCGHLTMVRLSIACGHMATSPIRSFFLRYPLGNDLKMAELVSAGLPASTLRSLAVAFGVQPSGIGPIVNITEKTILRRLKAGAKLKPDESERVARLMRVFVRAVDVLENEDNARDWLARPLRVLGGRTPLSLIGTEQGAREVEQVLGRLEHGVFA